MHKPNLFHRFSVWCSKKTGSSSAFVGAVVVVLVWALTGPVFNYSDTWQLVINTGTTVITFLMVFLIQNSQNKDTAALHLKLDAIIESLAAVNSKYAHIQDKTLEEIEELERELDEDIINSTLG